MRRIPRFLREFPQLSGESLQKASNCNGTTIAPVSVRLDCVRKEAVVENIASLAPGEGLKTEKMPGHWVLARLGKNVLRPGGMQLTRRMLDALRIQHADDVV